MTFCPLPLTRLRAPWLLSLALATCLGLPERSQAQPARSADYIVAVVNSEPITNSEVRARLARVEQQLARDRTAAPPRAELIRQVLERLIMERAQVQAARQAGIKVEEAAVDDAERNVARQNGIDVAEFRRRLAADGISQGVFREDLRNQLLLSRVREREVDSRLRVTEAEVDQYLREILVAIPESVNAAQLEALTAKARRLQAQARAGEDFAALARQASDATGPAPGGAGNGGAFGLRPVDRYPSLFVEATAALPVGGVSDVVRSGAGFHVLKVLEKRQSGGMTVVQTRSRHILLRPSPQLPEATARQRLAEYRQRIQSGQADFAALAREHSQDSSAPGGGDLGWANPGMFVPEFEEVMDDLAPGQVAEPFVSRFGVHLLQVLERRRTALSPREQREVARNQLRRKKSEEAYVQWAQDVRGRAFVDLREPPQ
jgi:peptidyl-prolyl cis-trans isomerase SurA